MNYRHLQGRHHSLLVDARPSLSIPPDEVRGVVPQEEVDHGVAHHQSYGRTKKYLKIEESVIEICPLGGSEAAEEKDSLIADFMLGERLYETGLDNVNQIKSSQNNI